MPTYVYSASTSGFCRNASVFDTLKLLKNAGYDGVDFPLSFYSRAETDPLRNDSWWRIWTEAVAAYAEELQLSVVQAHAPWHQTIATDFHYVAPDPIYTRIFEACGILHCKTLVFHPVQYPHRIVSAQTLHTIHQYNIQWFRDLLPLAEKFQIRIAIENTFDYYHLQMPSDPQQPYLTAADLLRLAEDVGSTLVGICLDTGHANIAGQNIPQMIKSFSSKLDCLHLNDNYGKRSGAGEDVHLFPTEGTIPWPEVFAALRQSDFRGAMNLEILGNLTELSVEKCCEAMRRGRENLNNFLNA